MIKMHAIYINSGLISGAEKRALKLCHSLNINGTQCKLLLSKRLFDNFNSTEYRPYLKHCVVIDNSFIRNCRDIQEYKVIKKYSGFNRFINWLLANNLRKIIKDYDIEVLHVFLYSNLKIIRSIQRNCGVKTIYEITSPDYVEMISKNITGYLEAFSHFNAVSDSVYCNALKLIPEEKISCAPIPFFDPGEHDIENKKLFERKENTIIFAHRLVPRKNGLLFARVAKTFLKENEGWTIKIFGHGPESLEINDLLSEEISNGSVVTGYRTKILPELEKSRVFISIIEPDNYPSQSVLEAMHAGNALLLSDLGFTKERFFDCNGKLCEISFEDILSKLAELVQDLPTLEKYGRKSLEILHMKYDRGIYLDYISSIYKSVEN